MSKRSKLKLKEDSPYQLKKSSSKSKKNRGQLHQNRGELDQNGGKAYRWTELQHQRYINFLAANSNLFKLSYQQKVKLRLQVLISKAVENRDSRQCRSHHQKMIKRFGSTEDIIKRFYQLLSAQNIQKHKIYLQGLATKAEDQDLDPLKIQQKNQLNNQDLKQVDQCVVSGECKHLPLKSQDEITYKFYK